MDRIRLTAGVAARLAEHHLAAGKQTESLSFLFGRLVRDGEEWLLLVCDPGDVILLADDCFIKKTSGHVSLQADVRAGVYWRARSLGFDAVIDVHDHFFSTAAHFSGIDDRDDLRTAAWFREKLPALVDGHTLVCASLLLAQKEWAARRVVVDEQGRPSFREISIDIMGEQFQRFVQPAHGAAEVFSRQEAIVGTDRQALLRTLRVAIVGAGGTGSIAIETVARMGVGEVRVIDADPIEVSNLNRLQGASAKDVGKNKASWSVARAMELLPETRFVAVPTDVFSEEGGRAVAVSDLTLVCVDNNETSWYVNRLCLQYAVPYWNVGVLIESTPHVVMHARMNAVIPGLTPCGECSDITFFARNRPEPFLDMRTLAAQRAAGYVQDTAADAPAPATYALNQQAVGAMLTEVLSWLCGWWPFTHSSYSRSDAALAQRLDRQNYKAAPRPDCAVCSFLLGAGDSAVLPRRGYHIELDEQSIPRGV